MRELNQPPLDHWLVQHVVFVQIYLIYELLRVCTLHLKLGSETSLAIRPVDKGIYP